MSDVLTDILRRLGALDRRLGQTEVKEVPLLDIGCRVYNSANISINNNTVTTLTFDSERDDTSGMHSTSVNTGRITFATAGTYHVGTGVRFASNATGYRQVLILKNGTTPIAQDNRAAVNGDVTLITIATRYTFVAGDYVEVQVYQNSGGALNVNAAADYSPEFWAQRAP